MSSFGLKDTPINDFDNESLGLKAYIMALSDFILNCSTPMTIAIQGDWGAGKTSTMNLIRERLVTSEQNIDTPAHARGSKIHHSFT